MKTPMLAVVATSAWAPWQVVSAQDLSSEVSPATVWFALLVVVFALLVAVGLFMAQDESEEEEPATPERRHKLAHPTAVMRKAIRRPTSNHRNQQEFS